MHRTAPPTHVHTHTPPKNDLGKNVNSARSEEPCSNYSSPEPPAPALYPAVTYIIHLCSYQSVYKHSARALSKPGTVPLAFKHTWNEKDKVLNCSLVTHKGNNTGSDFTRRFGGRLCVIDGLGQWHGCSPRCWPDSRPHRSQLWVDELTGTSAVGWVSDCRQGR